MSAGNRKNQYRPVQPKPVQKSKYEFLYILVLLAVLGLLIGAIIAGGQR